LAYHQDSAPSFRWRARLSDEDLALIADLLSLDRPTAGQHWSHGELDFTRRPWTID
jgi:hypothetical protein